MFRLQKSQSNIIFTVVIVYATLMLFSSQLPATEATQQQSKQLSKQQKTILVVGDSLSAAYGLREKTGWVDLLSQHLTNEASVWTVANASISGETTAGASERIEALLNQYQPGIVLIELGGNDGLRGFPLDVTYQNLEKMVLLSQQSKAKVILAGIHLPPNYGKKYEQLFYQNYTRLTTKYDLTMIPFILEGIGENPELMQKDGIHPKEKAQSMILKNVWPYLQSLL